MRCCAMPNGLLAILPLVITRRNGIRFAEFIGGKHANYHMGSMRPDFAAELDAADGPAMLTEIAAAIGGLDAFVFVNQPTCWQGVANPRPARRRARARAAPTSSR
jgi:CelD/BcsL family acetyltransferase involved in cellulose biosynthesis